MHESKEALRSVMTTRFCWAGLLTMALAAISLSLPLSAATGRGDPDIAADIAVISSPRTTLESLFRLTDRYHELVLEHGITRDNQERVGNLREQFKKLFDLREVAPKYRLHVASETAVYLREALARFPLPPMSELPDEDRMVARVRDGKAAIYQIAGTPVVVKRTDEGTYEGRYQFSSATVAEAKSWYETAKAYPFQEGQDYIEGLYEDYFLTPGPLIPVGLIRALPGWMEVRYLGQAVWQWLLVIATVVVFAGLVLLLHAAVKRLARSGSRVRRNLVLILGPIGVFYLILGARSFLQEQVFLSGDVLQNVLFVSKLVILAAVVFLLMRLGSILTELTLAASRFDNRQIEQQLVRLGIRVLTILIAVILVIEGMQQIGFSLATLVTGAGVAGLTIALAWQDTLKNVFGGLLLAMDRPFEVGQRVRMKGYEGFVEEVGLRSTKVRTIKGHQLMIPNDEAARIEVENIDRRPYIRRDMSITITYDTPPEKIARAIEILREILAVPEEPPDEGAAPHPNQAINRPGFPPRVYFNDLNADSLNLLVVYWFHPPHHWPSLEFANRVNMQIMERFNAEGIDFAFPSQTMYLAGDNKRPLICGPRAFAPEATTTPPEATTTPTAASPSSPIRTARRVVPEMTESGSEASIEEELLHGEDRAEADSSEDSTG